MGLGIVKTDRLKLSIAGDGEAMRVDAAPLQELDHASSADRGEFPVRVIQTVADRQVTGVPLHPQGIGHLLHDPGQDVKDLPARRT
jgi:hypothetical protein